MVESIESSLEEISKLGYSINNLFQIEGDRWRCNVRLDGDDLFFDFIDGDSAREVLDKMVVYLRGKPTGEARFKHKEDVAAEAKLAVTPSRTKKSLKSITLDDL